MLPKWAWGLIILVAFPFGVIAWLVMGRSRPGADPPGDDSIVAWRVDTSGATDRPAARSGVRPAGPPLIVATGLSKRYGTAIALDRVDLQITRGSTYGLIGPNGAGKTTIISVLAGLRRPTAGTVTLAVDRRKIALLVDTPRFEPWLTAAEVVDLARHLVAPGLPRSRVEQALAEVDLREARGPVGGFSRGMLQRLGLAACLVGDPALLILDEPCSALDPAGRREVLDLIGRLARTATVVLSTHSLADVQQVCDTVAVVDRGRIRFEARFIANASLLGRLAALVVGSDALGFDARSESAAFFRTRVDRARELLLPRYVVTTLTATLALIAGTVTAWTLTAVLIGPPPLLPVAVGTVYGVIHLAFAVAMLAAACGLTTNAASAVLLTFGVLALIPTLGIVPSVKPWLPSELVAAVVFLLDGTPSRDFGRAAAAATLATVGLLALAVRLHERREL